MCFLVRGDNVVVPGGTTEEGQAVPWKPSSGSRQETGRQGDKPTEPRAVRQKTSDASCGGNRSPGSSTQEKPLGSTWGSESRFALSNPEAPLPSFMYCFKCLTSTSSGIERCGQSNPPPPRPWQPRPRTGGVRAPCNPPLCQSSGDIVSPSCNLQVALCWIL